MGQATVRCQARILVVDDDAAMRQLAVRMLARAGYHVATADNGDQCLEAAFRSPPDVLLLDIALPALDGFSICRRLRKDARTQNVPIILMTALGHHEHRLRGLQAGADDFLAKPFDLEILQERVAETLRRKSSCQ